MGELNISGIELWKTSAPADEQNTRVAAPEVSDSKITAYPNPVTDNITVDLVNSGSQKVEISLVDPFGRKVISNIREVNNRLLNIDLTGPDLKSGVYYLKVEVNGRLEKVIPLVKE